MTMLRTESGILDELRRLDTDGLFKTIAPGELLNTDRDVLQHCPGVFTFDKTAAPDAITPTRNVREIRENQQWMVLVCVATIKSNFSQQTTSDRAGELVEFVITNLHGSTLGDGRDPLLFASRDEPMHTDFGYSAYPILFQRTVSLDFSVAKRLRGIE